MSYFYQEPGYHLYAKKKSLVTKYVCFIRDEQTLMQKLAWLDADWRKEGFLCLYSIPSSRMVYDFTSSEHIFTYNTQLLIESKCVFSNRLVSPKTAEDHFKNDYYTTARLIILWNVLLGRRKWGFVLFIPLFLNLFNLFLEYNCTVRCRHTLPAVEEPGGMF